MARTLKLTPSHYKILLTVSYLNKLGYYPLPEGVFHILTGYINDETNQFIDCPTYKSLISFNSKKVSRYIMMLIRYGYLRRKYDPVTDDMYLQNTPLADSVLIKDKKRYSGSLKMKDQKEKITIVKIV